MLWWVTGDWVKFSCIMRMWFRCIWFDRDGAVWITADARAVEEVLLNSPKQAEWDIVKVGTMTRTLDNASSLYFSNPWMGCIAELNVLFSALQNPDVLPQEPSSLHLLFSKKLHFISMNKLHLLHYSDYILCAYHRAFIMVFQWWKKLHPSSEVPPLVVYIKPRPIFMKWENDNIMNGYDFSRKNSVCLCRGRWSIVVLLELFEGAD